MRKHKISLLQTLGAWIKGQLREVIKKPVPANHPSRYANEKAGNLSKIGFDKDQGSTTRSKKTAERWKDDIEMSREFHLEGQIYVFISTTWEAHALKTLLTQKKSSVGTEFMGINCNSDEASHSEPELLEEPIVVMELALILDRDARVGELHGLQLFRMGNYSGPPLLLRNMEPTSCEDAHKFKRATDGEICVEAQERGEPISVSLFRKHNQPLLRQEIWRYNLPRSVGDIRKNLVALPKYQHTPSGNLRSVCTESSRCTKQVDGPNRMVSILG
ncbi:hypothetical protein AYI69_g3915 [Smittium culicis]|uniref:Uncharacterized protein n=1 Tax=Smittium culicis TaxID=133412 RepID=A0A1R1YIC1_9FUNG|nr:hypothetical protein AYI69_g3915 [Smittium culicis]